MYCFDTDTLSAVIRRDPPLSLIRRLARTPPEEQFTTAVTLGELLYGAAKRGSATLTQKVCELVIGALPVLPLDEPDLRIASIALSRGLVVVTGNVRHFSRVPDLKVENWLAD